MAIYHFEAKVISRGKGQSAIASASYRSGEKLYSERYNKFNFYGRSVSPKTFILKPNNAPDWTLNRQKLWNEVERTEKKFSKKNVCLIFQREKRDKNEVFKFFEL